MADISTQPWKPPPQSDYTWNQQPATQPATPAPAPSAPAVSGGGGPNLNPDYLRSQVLGAFSQKGVSNPDPTQVDYWVKKASTPDLYSDNRWRVGWNPYWQEKLITGAASVDPSKAGTEGVVGYQPPAPQRAATTDGGMAQMMALLQTLLPMQQQAQPQQPANPYAALAQAFQGMRQGPTVQGAYAGTTAGQTAHEKIVDDAIRKAFGGS